MGGLSNMLDTKKLAGAVRAKRGERSLREVEAEAGIPFNVLSRVERELRPDLENFLRICEWLGVPSDFFRVKAGEVA